MANNKNVGENELMCVGIVVDFGRILVDGLTEEASKKINEVVNESKTVNSVGMSSYNQLGTSFIILFKVGDFRMFGKKFFGWLEEKGYEPKVADRTLIVDKRYLEGGIYEGVMVDIPPQYMDDAIRKLILKYCIDVSVSQVLDSGMLVFEGEMRNRQSITVMYNRNFLGGGLKSNTAFCTDSPTRDYKRIIRDIDQSASKWLEENQGNQA